MYSTGADVPIPDLAAGSSILVSGPPMVGKRSLGLRLLAAGSDAGEGAVVVSTDTGGRTIQAEYAEFLDGDLDAPVGVVDCTTEHEGEGGFVYSASSPADLTGVGVGASTLLDHFHGEMGLERTRVGVFALTSMFLYADTDRVLKFTHGLTQRIREAGALGLLVAHTDTVEDDALAQLQTLVDGAIEVRERDDDREVRLQSPDRSTDWRSLSPTGPGGRTSQVGADNPTPETGTDDRTNGAGEREGVAGSFDSLSSIIEAVEAERPTLSVYNYAGEGNRLEELERFCERMNVGFRDRSLPDDTPCNVAMLHRGGDFIDAAPVQSVLGALEVTAADESAFAEADSPGLLSDLEHSTFGARGADRSFLVEISHVIETEAWRRDRGTLHAGFQELRRLWTDPETRRIYRRLAASSVEIHAYGQPGGDPPDWPGLTLHPVEDGEIADSWFVVYDGGGNGDAKATLLVEETTPGTYDGFWSYRPEVTDDTLSYLETAYGDGSHSNPHRDDPDVDRDVDDPRDDPPDDGLPAA